MLSRIPKTAKNALWLMFSAISDKVIYGAKNYRWKSPVSTIINKLFKKYKQEGIAMPYTMEDYLKEVKEEVLQSLTEEDLDRLLRGLDPEDRLRGLKPEDRLRGLKPEDRLRGLDPEDRLRGLKPEDRLRGLKPEEIRAIEEYLRKMKR